MEQPSTAHLVRRFGITYVLLVLGLSYFAIYPCWKLGEGLTFLVAMVWMLVLGAIVTAYGMTVVLFDEDGVHG